MAVAKGLATSVVDRTALVLEVNRPVHYPWDQHGQRFIGHQEQYVWREKWKRARQSWRIRLKERWGQKVVHGSLGGNEENSRWKWKVSRWMGNTILVRVPGTRTRDLLINWRWPCPLKRKTKRRRKAFCKSHRRRNIEPSKLGKMEPLSADNGIGWVEPS